MYSFHKLSKWVYYLRKRILINLHIKNKGESMDEFLIKMKNKIRIIWIFVICLIVIDFINQMFLQGISFRSVLVFNILSWTPVLLLPCLIRFFKKNIHRKGAFIYSIFNFIFLTFGNIVVSKYQIQLWDLFSMLIPYYILTEDSLITGEKQPFKDSIGEVFMTLLIFFWFMVGISQLLAIYSFVTEHIHIFLLDFLIALFISNVPVLGTIMGIISVHSIWSWSWLAAIALFVPGLFITPFLFASGILFETIQSFFSKNKE